MEVIQKNTELSSQEKIEFLKSMFSTLAVDEQAVFTQWCHEQVEKGGAQLLGQKMQEVNDKMNKFITRAYEQAKSGAKFVYDNTNQAFASKSENDEGPSFFSK